MNFFAKAILGCVAVLLVAAAVVLFFRSREASRVRALIVDAVGWAERGEADRVAALVDDDFRNGDWNAEAVRRELRRQLQPGAVLKLEISSLEVGVDGDSATARLLLKILRAGELQAPFPETFHLELRRRNGEWRVLGGGPAPEEIPGGFWR